MNMIIYIVIFITIALNFILGYSLIKKNKLKREEKYVSPKWIYPEKFYPKVSNELWNIDYSFENVNTQNIVKTLLTFIENEIDNPIAKGVSLIYENHDVSYALKLCSVATSTQQTGVGLSAGINGITAITGDEGMAISTGDYGISALTGHHGIAISTGYRGCSVSTYDYTGSFSTGKEGVSITLGYLGCASIENPTGIAVAWGHESCAKGCMGTYLLLSDWVYIGEKRFDGSPLSPYSEANWNFNGVILVKVDGNKVKPNTYYRNFYGNVVEVEFEYYNKM